MLHTNVKHEPSTYTEAITERGAQCTRYGFAQKKRNLLQETAVGIIFTLGPKTLFWSRIFVLFLTEEAYTLIVKLYKSNLQPSNNITRSYARVMALLKRNAIFYKRQR